MVQHTRSGAPISSPQSPRGHLAESSHSLPGFFTAQPIKTPEPWMRGQDNNEKAKWRQKRKVAERAGYSRRRNASGKEPQGSPGTGAQEQV